MIEKLKINSTNILKLSLGPLSVNCYILFSTKEKAIVIDPGAEGEKIVEYLKKNEIKPYLILNTHGHIDHVGNNWVIKENFPEIKVAMHREDLPYLEFPDVFGLNEILNVKYVPEPDIFLEEGNILEIGDLKLKILHTPGHTPGSISLLLPDKDILFSGDTIFKSSIGRTDLPGGNHNSIIDSINRKILSLKDETIIFPGHGENTSVKFERENNPFL